MQEVDGGAARLISPYPAGTLHSKNKPTENMQAPLSSTPTEPVWQQFVPDGFRTPLIQQSVVARLAQANQDLAHTAAQCNEVLRAVFETFHLVPHEVNCAVSARLGSFISNHEVVEHALAPGAAAPAMPPHEAPRVLPDPTHAIRASVLKHLGTRDAAPPAFSAAAAPFPPPGTHVESTDTPGLLRVVPDAPEEEGTQTSFADAVCSRV